MNWAVPCSAPTLLVSDTGKVIRLASSRRKGSGWQTFPELELRPRQIGAGYLAVGSKEQGVKRTHYVHRLVAEAFLGEPVDANEVNHLDGDKTNNKVENLEWTTHSSNLQHAVRTGLAGRVSLTVAEVRRIRDLISRGVRCTEIAEQFGVSLSAVNHIRLGHTWTWLK